MHRYASHFVLLSGFLALTLAGCKQDYSPNTYASTAAQEEATVQRGTIIGVRQVMISADGTIGNGSTDTDVHRRLATVGMRMIII